MVDSCLSKLKQIKFRDAWVKFEDLLIYSKGDTDSVDKVILVNEV